MSECKEPTAVMWTMVVEINGKRSTISWPSLCWEAKDARNEAETAFGCKVIAVQGSELLYSEGEKDDTRQRT